MKHRRRPCEKWPRRHDRRFTVGSVTGYLVTQGVTSGGGSIITRPPPSIWYVHDAANCYRPILETRDKHEAHKLARELNAREPA